VTTQPPATRPGAPGGLTAPSNASAQARGDGSILVSWTPGTPPDGYRIMRADNGGEAASTGGAATSATVTTVGPGETVAFVVEAFRGASTARSAPTNPVTTFSWPGAPGDVGITYIDNDGSNITFRVNWTAPPDNGRPINEYRVEASTADAGDQTSLRVPDTRSGRITLRCGSPRCDGTRVNVQVFASNEAGEGAPGGASYTHSEGPPPPRKPENGDGVITGTSVDGMTINVSLNNRWADWPERCVLQAEGRTTGSSATDISCGANSASLESCCFGTFDVYIYAYDPGINNWIRSAGEVVTIDAPPPPPDPEPTPTPSCDPDPCTQSTVDTSGPPAAAAGAAVVLPIALLSLAGLWAARRRRDEANETKPRTGDRDDR